MAITRIRHKGLRELFETGVTAKVDAKLQANALLILDHLDAVVGLEDCRGVKDFHPLKGKRAGRYSMHVSGNWCITFTFDAGQVEVLDLEDYHS
jgi:proteic killer suppression protein